LFTSETFWTRRDLHTIRPKICAGAIVYTKHLSTTPTLQQTKDHRLCSWSCESCRVDASSVRSNTCMCWRPRDSRNWKGLIIKHRTLLTLPVGVHAETENIALQLCPSRPNCTHSLIRITLHVYFVSGAQETSTRGLQQVSKRAGSNVARRVLQSGKNALCVSTLSFWFVCFGTAVCSGRGLLTLSKS